MIRQKNFLDLVQNFLQGFQFRINIRIELVRIVLTRFNPQCKTAATLKCRTIHETVTIRI
jgi:hypothetical protein